MAGISKSPGSVLLAAGKAGYTAARVPDGSGAVGHECALVPLQGGRTFFAANSAVQWDSNSKVSAKGKHHTVATVLENPLNCLQSATFLLHVYHLVQNTVSQASLRTTKQDLKGGRKGTSLCRWWVFKPYGLQDNYQIAGGERQISRESQSVLLAWRVST